MLVGDDPFDRALPIATLVASKKRKPPRVSQRNRRVPRFIDSFVARMMAPKPHKRFSDLQAVEEQATILLDKLRGT